MSETVQVKVEFVASETSSTGSTAIPVPAPEEPPKTEDIVCLDAVTVKREPQIESVGNAESTIESQDESVVTEPGAAEESATHKSRRRVKGVLKRLQDQVRNAPGTSRGYLLFVSH